MIASCDNEWQEGDKLKPNKKCMYYYKYTIYYAYIFNVDME